jgi:antitoxin PrlF
MQAARITAKGQMTIPKRIRQAARLEPGDLVALEVEGDRITLRKLTQGDPAYLAAVEGTLGEWSAREDEDAWRDL